MLRVKRVYEEPAASDGERILVDRLWPRGLTKKDARLDAWLKDLAPSHELRRWSHHDLARWSEFQKRYRAELEGRRDELRALRQRSSHGTVTLLYAASDTEHNNAVALQSILESLDD